MRIILLGATGYLGSNIAAALINSGHEVTAIIRPTSNAEILDKRVKLILNNSLEIENELQRVKYDWVINSACIYKQNDSFYYDMLDANLFSSLTDGMHRVAFDKVVSVMKHTGHDLPSVYKETSEGGLAKYYVQMKRK